MVRLLAKVELCRMSILKANPTKNCHMISNQDVEVSNLLECAFDCCRLFNQLLIRNTEVR